MRYLSYIVVAMAIGPCVRPCICVRVYVCMCVCVRVCACVCTSMILPWSISYSSRTYYVYVCTDLWMILPWSMKSEHFSRKDRGSKINVGSVTCTGEGEGEGAREIEKGRESAEEMKGSEREI
jgi:hypothetical protein